MTNRSLNLTGEFADLAKIDGYSGCLSSHRPNQTT